MNILLFTPDYADKMYGGIALDAKSILNDYLEHGHNVTLVISRYKSSYGDIDFDEKRSEHLRVIGLASMYRTDFDNCNSKINAPLSSYRLSRQNTIAFDKLIPLIGYGEFDCIHTLGAYLSPTIVLFAKHFEAKLITSVFAFNYNSTQLLYSYNYHLYSNSDLIMVINDNIYNQIQNIYSSIVQNKLLINYVLQPIAPVEEWKPIFIEEIINVVYLGRVTEAKGCNLLLESIAKVRGKTGMNVHLSIIGNGKYLDIIKFEVKSKELDYVHILGEIPNNEVSAHLSNAYLQLLPSTKDEGFPYVIREGLAAGTCILCSDVGGINERLINDYNCMFFKKNSILDLTEKMSILIHDENKRNYMALNAYNTRLSNNGKLYSEIIEEIMNQ